MKCTIRRTVNGTDPETTEVDSVTSKEEMRARIMREYTNDSRRLFTTRAVADVFSEEPSEWHIELTYDDGTSEELSLSFPDVTAEPYADDEAVWAEIEAAIPLFPKTESGHTTRFRMCVNNLNEEDIDNEVVTLVGVRVSSLPKEVLREMVSMGMDVIVKVTHPDGHKTTIGVGVRRATEPPDLRELLARAGEGTDLLRNIINELIQDDDDA